MHAGRRHRQDQALDRDSRRRSSCWSSRSSARISAPRRAPWRISGLSRLRLVKPRQGWPNEKARVMAAGADRVLDGASAVRHARRRDRRLQLRARHHRAQPRSGQARGRRGRGGSRDGAARRRRRDGRASCSGASASGWKTTRSRSPTASSRCRSIRPSPRSTWRRRWWSSPMNGSSSQAAAIAVRHAGEIAAGAPSSSSTPSSPISSASWRRSSSSAPKKSAAP